MSFALRCQVLAACRGVKAHLDVCANVIVEQQVQTNEDSLSRAANLFALQQLKTTTIKHPQELKLVFYLMRRPTIHDLTSKEGLSNISTFK